MERKDLERALSCIHAVARRAAELRMPYPKCVRLEVGLKFFFGLTQESSNYVALSAV